MTDRELLELAAKASGITGTLIPFYDIDGEIEGHDFVVKGCPWNPLTDDGDALRLAVSLGLITGAPEFFHYRTEEILNGNDPYAATRRAIVRAAAAIGEKP